MTGRDAGGRVDAQKDDPLVAELLSSMRSTPKSDGLWSALDHHENILFALRRNWLG
jgi:hypothetical protein